MAILTTLLAYLTLAVAGAVAGVFYAFSVSVMRGLDAIDPREAARAMRSINRKILDPLFLGPFMGAPVLAAATGGLLLTLDRTDAVIAFFAAAAVYAFGTFLPTVVINVPMNEALARASVPDDAGGAAALWAGYSPRWTRWNTIRTVAGVACLLLAGLGLYLWGTAA
ncbi:hypothetical protein C1I98_29495 [Spongiactinospora gelatinilytica]|uniref:DUF1772 domain-containing protein n=1 Tax=Spongiactinospora gelatinilytica TaxID=2666298 RepID=A0A2W2FA38_9ACTN|nr:anthrone oxygenase family protein [Spongiactinospora gelatinilytica]PZG32373.1 hypothetical protein C1I98_29495 [Spongiactinospora gelatinilytica]